MGLYEIISHTNKWSFRREKGIKEIMDENFLKLMKDINPQIQEASANSKQDKYQDNHISACHCSAVENKR